MKAGKLDRRITISVKTATRDTYGAEIIGWSTLATVWAEILPLSGREFFVASQFVPEAELKIRIRFREDFDETAKISYNNTDYDILHIAEIGRQDGLEIIVKKPL